MISPIILLNGNNPVRAESGLHFTGWYSIERMTAEGPYENISLSPGPERYVPRTGPLVGTHSNTPSIWIALTSGQICIAPKTSESPPVLYLEDMVVRGYYDLDTASNTITWHTIGPDWNENEIQEVRELSNPAYALYKKVSVSPEHVFLFGAGASFGSDGRYLSERGLLPPLGNALYPFLRDAPELKYWKEVPPEILKMFSSGPFEAAMSALDECEDGAQKSLWRDLELSLFFSRYRPLPSNLYWRLAHKIAKRMEVGWSGAAITLNYERLLEESCMRNSVFTVVKGVTYYDDNLPPFQNDQLLEICYPHGACQFFIGQTWFEGDGDIVFGDSARLIGNVGANHLLSVTNIAISVKKRQIPLICRYHPAKRPSVNNYFIRSQKKRAEEMIAKAQLITIVGVQCSHQTDTHIWRPLEKTKARLIYVEPGSQGQEEFGNWALQCGKKPGEDFHVIPMTFKDGFDEILKLNELQ